VHICMSCATNLSALKIRKSSSVKVATRPAKALSLFPVGVSGLVQVTVNVDPVSVSNFVLQILHLISLLYFHARN
jgi:hypothetical protein